MSSNSDESLSFSTSDRSQDEQGDGAPAAAPSLPPIVSQPVFDPPLPEVVQQPGSGGYQTPFVPPKQNTLPQRRGFSGFSYDAESKPPQKEWGTLPKRPTSNFTKFSPESIECPLPAWAKVERNPHTLQFVSMEGVHTAVNDVCCMELDHDTFPARPYKRRQGELKTTRSHKDRHKILHDIMFLAAYTATRDMRGRALTVLYVGASPGTHLGALVALFPHVRFVVFDPNPIAVASDPRVAVYNTVFTDATAAEYAGRDDLLLISSIRSTTGARIPRGQVEEYIRADMDAQRRWVGILRPRAALVKLRLPWRRGTTEYMDGVNILPICGTHTQTTTRLIVSGAPSVARAFLALARLRGLRSIAGEGLPDEALAVTDSRRLPLEPSAPAREPSVEATREYSNTRHEDQMFFFNTVRRLEVSPTVLDALPDGTDTAGLCHCFDCAAEVCVLAAYAMCFPRAAAEFAATDALLPDAPAQEAGAGDAAPADAELFERIDALHEATSEEALARTVVALSARISSSISPPDLFARKSFNFAELCGNTVSMLHRGAAGAAPE